MAVKLSNGIKAMEKIVDKLYKHQEAVPFRDPVNWRELGLTDYPLIIKRPMALSDVKTKIVQGQYRSTADVAEDMNLIWTNCMDYNMEGSDFFKLANKFKDRFEKELTKVKATTEGFDEANNDAELDRTPSLEEQTQFAHNIYMIKSEELGEVVTKLDQSCPHALDKKQDGKDEIEINIDAIDNRTFHIIDRLVKSYLPDVMKKAKKATKGDGPASKKQKS
mmetsp:Transcript_19988/g.41027  ORF Transcript_19988/g.41027 Transcript_19988/m.41027 type:complete len:221 (-) Transcript_19988:176-838(-)